MTSATTTTTSAGLFRRWLEMPVSLGEGRSERDLLVLKMSQWLIEHDRLYYNSHVIEDIHDAIAEILDIITNLVGMLKSSSQMLAVIMLYADKFVKRSGIKHNQLFNLLLTSTVVTVKFWNEAVVVSNKNIAQVFEFSLEDVNLMERRFLAGIEYALCLDETDVKNFLLSMISTPATPFSVTVDTVMVPFAKKCGAEANAQGVVSHSEAQLMKVDPYSARSIAAAQ